MWKSFLTAIKQLKAHYFHIQIQAQLHYKVTISGTDAPFISRKKTVI